MLAVCSFFLATNQGQMSSERAALLNAAHQAVQTRMQSPGEWDQQPQFHFHAPAQWMNDPNGPIYFRGWYHVFYQFNPYGDHWARMHWGHARSRNLVDWEDMAIALWPTKSRGEDHIYSGSSFLPPSGKLPMAFYTSISGQRKPEQWAAVAEDADLKTWRKAEKNPVVTSNLEEWRDPFLFAYKGGTYMVTGGGEKGRGIVALYKAADADLTQWEFRRILFHHPDADVRNIECPNIAQFGVKWLLLVSVHGRVESFVGYLDSEMEFVSESRGVLNEGSYASQLMLGPKGEVIHLAWMHTEEHKGWNGFLTLPSLLKVSRDGVLTRTPVPQLRQLREEKSELGSKTFSGEWVLPETTGGELLEIEGDVEYRGATALVVQLRRSADGSRAVRLEWPASQRTRHIHLYLDHGVADDYEGLGRSIRFNALPEDQGVALRAEGGEVRIKSLSVYELRPAMFDHSFFTRK